MKYLDIDFKTGPVVINNAGKILQLLKSCMRDPRYPQSKI